MTKATAKLSAKGHSQLEGFGARIKAARLRRNLPQALVAERAGVSLMTYRAAESGSPGCALGTYMAILEVLKLSDDLDLMAKEDVLGRELQDSALHIRASTTANKSRARVNKSFWPSGQAHQPVYRSDSEVVGKDVASRRLKMNQSGSVSSNPVVGFVKTSTPELKRYKGAVRGKRAPSLTKAASVEINADSLKTNTNLGKAVAMGDLMSLLVKPKSDKG